MSNCNVLYMYSLVVVLRLHNGTCFFATKAKKSEIRNGTVIFCFHFYIYFLNSKILIVFLDNGVSICLIIWWFFFTLICATCTLTRMVTNAKIYYEKYCVDVSELRRRIRVWVFAEALNLEYKEPAPPPPPSASETLEGERGTGLRGGLSSYYTL